MHSDDVLDAESASGPTVLVVDDDAAVRKVLSLTLSTDGFRIIEASNGRQALTTISEQSVDLVLLDQQMPGMGGSAVLKALRADPATRTVPVILVTGETELDDRVGGLDDGALDYITKPFELDDLRARVRAQLRGAGVWREEIRASFAQRTAMAEALGRAATKTGPEDIAHAICEELSALPHVGSATLIALVGPTVSALGCAGPAPWGIQLGGRVTPALGRYLAMRAGIGPWIERPGLEAPGDLTAGLLSAATIACAPLTGSGTPAGLLLLAVEPGTPTPRVADTLAAAIDFAAVVSGVLGPALFAQRKRQAERGDLFSVLAKSAFQAHFQPIVDLDRGTVVGFEALTRFDDGTPPDQRFGEASRLGIGPDLEAATIAAAIHAAVRLPARRWLSLNVSPGFLLETARLRDLLSEADHDVVLELSEHDPVEDYEAVRSALGDPGLNVLLSIDDAGSGFASLRHVLKLEPAFMKLDRSWVAGIEGDPARRALVAGLQSFADNVGCRLIAEGIETEPERATLAGIGVHLGQGYLFAAPNRLGALDGQASPIRRSSIRTLAAPRPQRATAARKRSGTA